MDYVVSCPACAQEILLTPEFAGQPILCPHCSVELVVPQQQTKNIAPAITSGNGRPPRDDSVVENSSEEAQAGDAPKSFTAKLSEFGKAAFQEGQRNAHMASAKAKIEKLKLFDLPKAHLALGQKSYSLRLQPHLCQSLYEETDQLQQEIASKRAEARASGGAGALDKAKQAALSTKLLAEIKVLEHKVKQRLITAGKQAAACADWPDCAEEINAVAAIVGQIEQHKAAYATAARDFSERIVLKNVGTSLAADARAKMWSLARTGQERARGYWAKPHALHAALAAVAGLAAVLLLGLWWGNSRGHELSKIVKESAAFEEYGQYGVVAADVRDLRNKAWWGDPIAQYKLSVCYVNGRGVDKDPEEGFRWLMKSARADNPVAQVTLGGMYFRGITPDGEQDPEEGLRWMHKAAEQGDARSEGMLGIIYYQGTGISQDKEEGLKWLRKAAAQGDEAVIDFMRQANISDPAVKTTSRRREINEYSAEDQQILQRLLSP